MRGARGRRMLVLISDQVLHIEIDNRAGFTVTAQGEGTEDTFTITHRPSGTHAHKSTAAEAAAAASTS